MANHIKRLRLERGLTQPQLAALMGTTKNQLIKLEGGDRRLHEGWIERAAKALGVSNAEIIDTRHPSATPAKAASQSSGEILNGTAQADIGNRLRAAREALGLSVEVISKITDLSTAKWNSYEQGNERIDIDSAVRLARITGIPLDWIYLGDETLLPARLASSTLLRD